MPPERVNNGFALSLYTNYREGVTSTQPLLESPDLDAYAERILASARELFARHGLRRTSLADIASHAKIAPATLYKRFANREALLTALVLREANQLMSGVDAAVEGIDDPEEALVASFLVFIRALRDHDLLQEVIALDPELVLPLFTTEGAAFLSIGREYLASHLERARDEGVVLTAEPVALAEIFMRIAQSLILTPHSVLPLDDEVALAELASNTFARLAFVPATSNGE